MRKMVCISSLSQHDVEQISRIAPGWEVVHGLQKEQLILHLKDAEILAGWSGAAATECFQPDAKLRWVQNWGAGVDRIPLAGFVEKGVTLTNASGVHAFPISETIFAMLLSFARKVHLSTRNQAKNAWKKLEGLSEIHGKTIGIVGVGAIGEETARLAKAFGMNVLGIRRSGKALPFVDSMYDHEGLETVLEKSDFVVVTLPLTKETRHMFGQTQFEVMKPTAYFINIGRGGTTNTEALIAALSEGKIAGAGLDVFEQEPLPETSPLWDMENVIITPHNSGATDHYNERIIEIFLRNLEDYVQGREPSLNRVDLEKQY